MCALGQREVDVQIRTPTEQRRHLRDDIVNSAASMVAFINQINSEQVIATKMDDQKNINMAMQVCDEKKRERERERERLRSLVCLNGHVCVAVRMEGVTSLRP